MCFLQESTINAVCVSLKANAIKGGLQEYDITHEIFLHCLKDAADADTV